MDATRVASWDDNGGWWVDADGVSVRNLRGLCTAAGPNADLVSGAKITIKAKGNQQYKQIQQKKRSKYKK